MLLGAALLRPLDTHLRQHHVIVSLIGGTAAPAVDSTTR